MRPGSKNAILTPTKLRDNQKKTKFDPYLANVKVLVTVHVNLNLTRTFPAITLAFIDRKEPLYAQFFRTMRKREKKDFKRRI